MKNILIAVLLLAVGGLGYAQLTSNEFSSGTQNGSVSSDKPAASSGSTLDLSNKGLTKLEHDLLDNGSVTTLDVSGNNLTGSLPGEIRKLTNLEVLNASDNNMTGVPAEIGQLRKLRTAKFANNNLSGLPNEIGNLSNLETLDLRGNPNISKQDIASIQSKVPNAKILVN